MHHFTNSRSKEATDKPEFHLRGPEIRSVHQWKGILNCFLLHRCPDSPSCSNHSVLIQIPCTSGLHPKKHTTYHRLWHAAAWRQLYGNTGKYPCIGNGIIDQSDETGEYFWQQRDGLHPKKHTTYHRLWHALWYNCSAVCCHAIHRNHHHLTVSWWFWIPLRRSRLKSSAYNSYNGLTWLFRIIII